MRDTVRLNFDFPRKDFPYLKMMCAEKGLSFRELATKLLYNALKEYEDMLLGTEARQRLSQMDPKDTISFDDAMKEAGLE